jgi:hypothetical protein
MATLELPTDMEGLRKESVQKIREFLRLSAPSDIDITTVRVAGTALSATARYLQAMSANKAIDVGLVTRLADGKPDELRHGLRRVLPGHPLVSELNGQVAIAEVVDSKRRELAAART